MENSFKKYTSELDEYIAKTKSRLSAILSALEWNEEETLKTSTCSEHLTQEEDKDDPNDPLLPESFESMHSIVIDEEKLKEIVHSPRAVVPKRFSDIQLNFTREQKLALYDYVVKNTGKISEPELKVPIASDGQGVNDMTFAEIVAKAKKKDKKLKRKYRTSKPTHIEEVRNLVHLQMQALEQYFTPKPALEDKNQFPGGSGIIRSRRRSISRSRRRSRSFSWDRKKSRYDRDWSHNRHRRQLEPSNERNGRSKDRISRSKERRNLSHGRRDRSKDREKRIHSEDKRHSHGRRDRSKDREKRIHSEDKRHSKKTRKRSKSPRKSSKSKKRKHHHKSKHKH